MSREQHALAGARSTTDDDDISDVALVYPRGSTGAGVVGAAVGGALGNQSGTAIGSWQIGGMIAGQRLQAKSRGTAPSILLAVSDTFVYALGRDRTGTLGGWKNLTLLAKIPRDLVAVTHHRRGPVVRIDLIDTATGTPIELESRLIGGLGVKQFLETVSGETKGKADG